MAVSGGKDSQALAHRVCEHLDAIAHGGPRLLIHSDLGRVEWRQSLSVCERLADRLGVELLIVRRQAGDMMDRWLSRWDANDGNRDPERNPLEFAALQIVYRALGLQWPEGQ
jgi:3'-phosphoadenosine 5'-phosphosulfate sulfotransferase (PAPS reductase)/FAD synthetase